MNWTTRYSGFLRIPLEMSDSRDVSNGRGMVCPTGENPHYSMSTSRAVGVIALP